MSLNQNYTQTKSLNGVNYIDADEITTDVLNVTTLTTDNIDVNDLTVNTNLTLPLASILDSYLSSNVALLNRLTTQTFDGNIDFNANTFFRKNVEFLGTPSGQNLFQAYKNTSGNAGHILANVEGELLYYDTTASATKWKLDTSGNFDITGTLISKSTTGDFIRSNSGVSQYFYATNGGQIGYADSTSNIGVRWNINSNGTARFVSSSNTYKYWEIAGNLIRYYNTGGGYSIILNGDSGLITSPGVPVNGTDLINKTYGDATYPSVGSVVNISGTQTISGLKTFSNVLTTTGGITATASQSISFGTNNPTMGASNINYGTAALRVGTGGTYSQKSIAIGTTNFGTAIQSVAIGDQALNASGSTANYSVAIGVNSLKLATGDRNTAIGTDSLPLLTGTGNGANTAIGNLTGTKLTGGTNNLFLGLGSGSGITSGTNNLIVGSSMFASVSPDTGTAINNNICVGSNAMGYIKNNCSTNTAIGSYALYSELGYGGVETVAIGGNAGVRSRGSGCVFIGNEATVDVANSIYNYSMALGYGAKISASNQIKIGTSAQNTIIAGDLQIGGNLDIIGTIPGDLQIGGNLNVIGTIGLGGVTKFSDIDTVNIDATGDLYVIGTINSGNINCAVINSGAITTTGDIDTGLYDIYTDVVVSNQVNTVLGIDIQDGTNGVIQFSGGAQKIRIGTTTLIDGTPNGIVIGNGSTTYGSCITIGNASFTTNATRGTGSVIVGNLCEALGNYSINVGHNAISVQNGVAIGRQARAGSNVAHTEGIAIGKESLSGTQAVSIGANNQANAQDAVSIGKTAYANGQGAVSIGGYAQSNGVKSIAVGYNSQANFDNAISIGDSVQATAVNEFRLGNTSNKILLKQIYYPFEISPTNITGTGGLPASPYYGTYRLASAGAITITLPVIVTGMEGIVLRFRKTTTPLASGISVTCSAGNTYFPFNSITATAAGVTTAFIGGGQTQMSACVISATQWAVIT